VQSGAVESSDPKVVQLVHNLARYLHWIGDTESSRELSQQAYSDWREKLGEESEATLGIGHWLGFTLFVLGRYEEAARQNSRILELYRGLNSGEDEYLLRALGAVAADRRVSGNIKAALEIDRDIYSRHVQLLGGDDPSTLNAAHNLAVSLRLDGDLKGALALDEQTYRQRLELFGEEHVHTLESELSRILDHRELGEYRWASRRMESVVEGLSARGDWGLSYASKLKARRILASCLRKAGDHVTALEISEEVRSEYSERFGSQHPETIVASLGLLVDRRVGGFLEDALVLGGHLSDDCARIFGHEHVYTISALINTNSVRRLAGDSEGALETDQAGVRVLGRTLGPDHPLTLAGSINLANDLFDLERFDEAYERDSTIVSRLEELLGESHPTTLLCQSNLAMDLLNLGRELEARELHGRVVPPLEAALGDEHPATIAGKNLELRAICDLDPMPL
jgi:tetratricopeptide (TPR) repeat protein